MGVFILFLSDIYLIYNVVLTSSVQQSDSVIHMFFFRFFSIIGYYTILSIGPCVHSRFLFLTYFIYSSVLGSGV